MKEKKKEKIEKMGEEVMEENLKITIHYGNEEKELSGNEIKIFRDGMSNQAQFIKFGSLYVNKNAITYFEVEKVEQENSNVEFNEENWSFLSGDYSNCDLIL